MDTPSSDFEELLAGFNANHVRAIVFYLGRAEFLRNKRAAGRPQDLADVDPLE